MEYASEHEYDAGLEYGLCAVIVRGGSVLSVGYNKRTTNSFVDHFIEQSRGIRDFCETTHSEMDAVLKARAKSDLRGSKIFVVRRKKDGSFGTARPCEICQKVLFSYGISRAIYSIDDRTYGVMKISGNQNGEHAVFVDDAASSD
jgi:deoxycytidylate deaminase